MAKEYYCYPREGFVPETRELPDGSLVAHAGDTPIWMSHDLRVYALDGEQFVQLKVNTSRNRNYGQLSPGGFRSGHTYPRVDYKGKTYYVHRLMAIAWIGAIPEGWQVDHINGDIYNWRRDNIRIVTVAENVRCAVILRARRMIARQDNDPKKDPVNMKPEELLELFSMYNVAGDCYDGE